MRHVTTAIDLRRTVARRIAHEIKNPLTPIKLSAERLKKKFLQDKEMLNSDLREYADMIIRQTKVLQRIVDEFSKFSRMPEPRKENINIKKVIKSAVLLQKTMFPKIEFNVLEEEENFTVLADVTMITQALTNLLKNAAESIEAAAKDKDKNSLEGMIAEFYGKKNGSNFKSF